MSGGPSHHDLWDYKPKMREMFGKDLPEHVRDGQRITGMTAGQKTLPGFPSKYTFTKHKTTTAVVGRNCCRNGKVAKELGVVTARSPRRSTMTPGITNPDRQPDSRPAKPRRLASYGLGRMNENCPATSYARSF
ncbi:MAG: hypothetical protein CM1200mP34_3000 [Verrucomicrobiales bacterium]|nr:MAG: hypothetical protein CM1200mP34_3000 [Verrucomicrobiales bacterium]